MATIIRYADGSEEFAYAFSLAMLALVLLLCCPFFDPERDFKGRSRR